ncbi:hypothetical protein BASA61_000225 [Batrachochytrium salamandrivorans]|nr:hypothetical protein BASA61_000225 [Batrachochytrium salamandrivorans]KAH9277303.1 hypothetical protein BASA83_000170 [Batrachochytrium salamandrivorans]
MQSTVSLSQIHVGSEQHWALRKTVVLVMYEKTAAKIAPKAMKVSEGTTRLSCQTPHIQTAVPNAVWGFDPLELLARTVFPNHDHEKLLRVSKAARMASESQSPFYSNYDTYPYLRLAVKNLPLDLLNDVKPYRISQSNHNPIHNTTNLQNSAGIDKQSKNTHFEIPSSGGRQTPSSWSVSGTIGVCHNSEGSTNVKTVKSTPEWSRQMGLSPSPPPIVKKVYLMENLPSQDKCCKLPNDSQMLKSLVVTNGSRHGNKVSPVRIDGVPQNLHQHHRPTSAQSGGVRPTSRSSVQQMTPVIVSELSPTQQLNIVQLARSAAALIIQSCYRGWSIRRKYLLVAHARLSIISHSEATKELQDLPGVDDFTEQEMLWARYLRYCSYFDKRQIIHPEYSQFCAAYIQSIWRRFVVRRAWCEVRTMIDRRKINRATLEAHIRRIRYARKPRAGDPAYEISAIKIQRIWRRYYNIRIYSFYRDLIKYSEHGDPKQLLKFINPKEAQYVEDGVGAHIRFRLGGHTFPPVIYYKVFVHQSIIDMNAFSPRNYTEEKTKQLLPRQRFNKAYTLTAPCESDTWYHRFENNEWRPVSETTWGNNCMHLHSVIIASPVKRPFHHVKTVRHQDILRRRKERKMNWMRHMYHQGVQILHPVANKNECNKSSMAHALDPDLLHPTDLNARVETSTKIPTSPHTINTYMGIDHLHNLGDLNDEVDIDRIVNELDCEHPDFLIKWTRALDFESYQENWTMLATTQARRKRVSSNSALKAHVYQESLSMPFIDQPQQEMPSHVLTQEEIPHIHFGDSIDRKRPTNKTSKFQPLPPLPSRETQRQRPGSGSSQGSDRSVKDMLLSDHDILKEF